MLIKLNVLIFYLSLNLCPLLISGQGCLCPIEEIITEVERDYPGFEFIKKSKDFSKYLDFKKNLLQKKKNNSIECEISIYNYISYFKDAHLSTKTNKSVESLGFNKGVFKVNNNALLGNWTYVNGSFEIKIKKTKGGQALAIYEEKEGNAIINSDTFLYFIPTANANKFYVISKLTVSSHQIDIMEMKNSNCLYKDGKLMYRKNGKIQQPVENGQDLEFKKIDTDICYLKIKNFTYISQTDVDSLMLRNDNIVTSTKCLVVDLRDNGGGNTSVIDGLYKYISDGKPFKNLAGYRKATDTLINNYSKICNSIEWSTPKLKYYCDTFLPKMKHLRGELFFDSSIVTTTPKMLKPQKVVFLMNENTASAAEMAIYNYRKSSKVIVVGSNSNGAMDSGSPIPYTFNCGVEVNIPTTVCDFYNKKRYDFKGMKPDVRLFNRNPNWVKVIKSLAR